jgi:MFS family permease
MGADTLQKRHVRMSATTAAAVIGRLATGLVVDRLNRRLVTSATLVIQIAGLTLLAWAPSAVGVYTVCALFGLGVGNLTTLPGLILAVEWPREQFSALVSLVVGINQFTFAFGPSLVGVMRDRAGIYGPALGAFRALQLIVSAMILLGPGQARSSRAVGLYIKIIFMSGRVDFRRRLPGESVYNKVRTRLAYRSEAVRGYFVRSLMHAR